MQQSPISNDLTAYDTIQVTAINKVSDEIQVSEKDFSNEQNVQSIEQSKDSIDSYSNNNLETIESNNQETYSRPDNNSQMTLYIPNEHENNEYLFIKKEEPKKRSIFLYCIPVSTEGKWICGIATFLVLVLIAVILGLYWPRMPEFDIVQLLPDPNSFNLTQIQGNYVFTLALVLTVNVQNNNRYGMNVQDLDLTAHVQPNITSLRNLSLISDIAIPYANSRKVASGLTSNIHFPAYSSTSFKMNINLLYNSGETPLGAIGDPLFFEIQRVCDTKFRELNNTLKLTYTSTAFVNGLYQIAIKPTFNQIARVSCPFVGDQYPQLIQRITTNS